LSDRIANIFVLAEDQEQQSLIRKYLVRAGHGTRDIRDLPLPGNRGCGSQYVREQFLIQVAECRGRIGRKTKSMLVVMTDADSLNVTDREKSLAETLKTGHQAPVSADEPIIILIPKWQVETWIKCLLGHNMSEDDPKSDEPRVTRGDISDAAEILFRWSRANALVGTTCVPSLRASLPRWNQIG
jgi:hypothetical protein